MKTSSTRSLKGVLSILLAITIIISGCETLTTLEAFPPPYSLPVGSTLSINQDLTVAPNSVSVWIQFGKVVSRKDVDLSLPNCHFEMYTLRLVEQTIYKDEVAITRFVNRSEYVSNGNVMYASLVADADDGGGPMAEIFRSEIYLKSAKQPDLFRLTCEEWDDLFNGIYLTVDQIQQALGKIATFKTPNRISSKN